MCIHDSTCPTSLYRAQVQSKTDAAVERIHKGRTRQSSLPDLLQDLLVGIGTHIQGAGDRFKTGMTTLSHDAQKDQGIIEPPEHTGFHRITSTPRRAACEAKPLMRSPPRAPSRYSTASGCASTSLKLACPPTVKA